MLGAALGLLPLACRRTSDSAPVPAASSSAHVPLDRLAPNELSAGEEALFGLKLPRGMTIQGRFKDSALALGELSVEAVTQYVRGHVDASQVEVGTARTVFPSARVRGAEPSAPLLRIEVTSDGGVTRLHVRDMTPKPAPRLEGLSNDDLWRRAGFDRSGKPLEPKRLE